MSRAVIRLLPDGSGRVRIHWFIHDPKGPIETVSSVTMSAIGPIKMGGARGRIACQPQRTSIAPEQKGSDMHIVTHSDDVRGATCPECLATPEAKAQLADFATMLDTAGEGQPRQER